MLINTQQIVIYIHMYKHISNNLTRKINYYNDITQLDIDHVFEYKSLCLAFV